MLIDVKKAHLKAPATREVYVELPKEDPRSADPEAVGELLRTMYGTMDAGTAWEDDYNEVLRSAGYNKKGQQQVLPVGTLAKTENQHSVVAEAEPCRPSSSTSQSQLSHYNKASRGSVKPPQAHLL